MMNIYPSDDKAVVVFIFQKAKCAEIILPKTKGVLSQDFVNVEALICL